MTGAQSPIEGRVVRGRYETVRLLGRGGFGATYLVRDRERFDTLRALKELIPSGSSSPKVRELFEREARTLMALANERIPAMHAYFDEDDRFFLVQDYLQGEALDTRLERLGPLPEDEVVDIVLQVLEVLDYLHSREPAVVHRDIKPSNLMRDEQGRISLIDFGAVREALAGGHTGREATIIGTAGYAPLEQIVGRPVPASDLYALGATALHLLTGRPPVDWHDVDSGELVLDERLTCSARMRRILTSLLADLPERAPSVRATRAMLLTGEAALPDSGAAPTEVADRQGSALASARARPVPGRADAVAPAGTAPVKRGRGRVLAAAGAGAVVLAGALWVTLQSEATPALVAAVPSTDSSAATDASIPPQEQTAGSMHAEPRTASSDVRPLRHVAAAVTPNGLTIEVRYPDGWEVVSGRQDGHVAVRDPVTNTLFIAGLDETSGAQTSAGAFAERWEREVAGLYAPVRVLRPAQLLDDASMFRLEVADGARPAAPGTLVIAAFSQSRVNRTAFQWWASLRNDASLIPTLQAMAGALAVADPASG